MDRRIFVNVVTTGDFESVISFLSTSPSNKGCFQIETNDGSQIEFHDQTTIDGESNLGIRIISPNALNIHFDNTDKRCLFIDSSKNLSKDILSLYELLKGKKRAKYNGAKTVRVLGQIKDQNALSLKVYAAENPKEKKEELLKEYTDKNQVVPVGNKIFGDNNAIPSWSGFNFQGKAMLLRVLQHINELINEQPEDYNDDVTGYSVEIELREDFVLLKDNRALEFCQVKAMLKSDTYSEYVQAVQQLVDHRSDDRNAHESAECVMMSAVKIDPWESTEVHFYLYEEKYLDLISVIGFIQTELSRLMTKIVGLVIDEQEIENYYLKLCAFLDDKVSSLHNKSELSFDISYQQIIAMLISKHQFFAEIEEQKFKEKLYIGISKQIESAFEEYCAECKESPGESDCSNCIISRLKENFVSVNFDEYAQVLMASQNLEKLEENLVAYSSVYNVETLKNLLELYRYANIEDYQFNQSYHYLSGSYYENIIPTELDASRNEYAVSSMFKKIQLNTSISQRIMNKKLTIKTPYKFTGDKNIIQYDITKSVFEHNENLSTEVGVNFSLIDAEKFKESLRGVYYESE